MIKFRDLQADEIECRVKTINKKGLSLLLYKDARCDMNILDETLGGENWQRRHTRENANCIVSVWDDEKKQWIEKEDTGTESNTEAAKGLASDSFKRACFNWGIGRELYTAPRLIWVGAHDCNIQEGNNGKCICYDTFSVCHIVIEDKRIIELAIMNDKTGRVVFEKKPRFRGSAPKEAKKTEKPEAKTDAEIMNTPIAEADKTALLKRIEKNGCSVESVLSRYGVASIDEMTFAYFNSAMRILDRMETKAKES
ncbi:MAG: hypothetical protein Q4B26_11110 [Eubacteriales bacterium]|nr:hypothetical protein [Eubacteriales bacterium]